jgi:Zn-dependent protease with chaperone function
MSADEVWRRKTDDELLAAVERLEEYTEEGQRVIRAELERRHSPEYLLAQEALLKAKATAEHESDRLGAYQPLDTNKTASMARRILLAISLMIGFYVFALAIAVALLWIPYAEWTYVGRLDFRLAGLCIGAGLTILWALVPRADRFKAPGPRLEEARYPRLFEIIRQIATATHQAPPADVYLLNEVNAWVTHRGGTMGFGSHRVMGVGLPLLQAISVPAFKAIVAHEFGHYWSGDVKLGPWIYKTRAAIARTIAGVRETFVEAPFRWYGRQFLKLTHAVSRQQEFVADQVAARTAGGSALASALRRITALAPLYSSYLTNEVLPTLRAGFLPPVAEGFKDFLKADRIVDASRRIIEAAEEHGQTDLFDTHPSLRDRLAALSLERDRDVPSDQVEPAVALIGNPSNLARALVEFALGPDATSKLAPIAWNLVGESVFAKEWREVVRSHSQWLSRFSADGLPVGKHAFIRVGSDLVRSDELNVNSEARIARAVNLFAGALAILLIDDGWRASTSPGMPVVLVRGSQTVDPLAAVQALADEGTTREGWKAECNALGIAGRPLGSAATTPRPLLAVAPVSTTPTVQPAPSVERSEKVVLDQIRCWRCKHALMVNSENRGKTVRCPQCGTKQQLPL